MRKPLLAALAALVCATPLAGLPAIELFPAEPGVNAERGFAVAVDGDWLAMGAPRDDEKGEDAGAVYLFHWSGTTWDQEAKLFAEHPRERAHLGFSLALRDGVLAAGAPGEGAVHLFALNGEGAWAPVRTFTGPPRAFGRSLALDANRLAVGAVGGHGETDGAAYLYIYRDGSWRFQQKVRPRTPRKGERFGAAVSLAGKVLAVGAPGHGPGAVYLFQRDPSRWIEKAKLPAPDSPPDAGDQFGASVATDGTRVFAGAPTADLEGDNSGAVYGFAQGAEGWNPRRLKIEAAAGTQLGTSLALSGDLLVAGAPAPPPEVRAGGAHVFRLSGPSREILQPANAEIRDLAGFAVAVDGERVVVGGVLGDQADGAAGAVWSFRCSGEGCAEEAEAVARDDLKERVFGVSVALGGESLAVGAPDETSTGAVYLYRRAGESGWRQEERLASIHPGDGFGSSVALDGDLLAVGAPRRRSDPVSPPLGFPHGSVDLFVRRGSSWVFEATLVPPEPGPELIIIEPVAVAFGASVSVSEDTVAVGAPGRRAVYLFKKEGQSWTSTALTYPAFGFGAVVSLRGDVLAAAAPGGIDGAGAAYVSVRENQKWPAPLPLPAFGSSVSVGERFLAVGAPGSHGVDGAVFLFEKEGTSWGRPVQLPRVGGPGYGFSVALSESWLAVGAPDPEDPGRAFLFDLESGDLEDPREFVPLTPLPGGAFGFAVALSDRFLVVTSPGADRATVFDLTEGELP